MKRKLVPISEAVSRIAPGSTIAIGGSLLRRQPMALVHELIRRDVRDLSVMTWASSLATDMLAAAGCLRAWEGIYVGLWWHGLAPNFRRAIESGEVLVTDHSESYMTARFRAAAMGLPFLPVVPIWGTGMSARSDIREVLCPYTGVTLQTVEAARPDTTILHGYVGDEYGNVAWPAHRDSDDLDLIMASGSKRLVVSVERIVSHQSITESPNLTYIPHTKVEAICEAPFGAFPGSCDTMYDEDEEELMKWSHAGRTADEFRAYLRRNVVEVADHEQFLHLVGQARMDSLKVNR